MRKLTNQVVCLVLSASFFCVPTRALDEPPQAANSQATASKPSAGTTIGTMVKDAITAALPGVSSIINLIWGSAPNSNKKAADAQTKLSTPDSQKSMADSAKAQAKPFIQPATQIADELAVVEKFASASSQATQNLVTMQTLLSVTPQPSNLLERLKEEWGLAADLLAPLFAQTVETDIKKVRNSSVQGMLLQIHEANTNVSGRIANRMKATKISDVDLPALKDLVAALIGLLSGTNTVAAAELNNLQQELSSLAVWANSPSQGGENLNVVVPDTKLVDFTSKQIATARAVVSRTSNN
jgi:hypothetical protein